MHVTRTLCPHCGRELDKRVEKPDDLSCYEDNPEFALCDTCQNSPEARLLNAIFSSNPPA